MTGDDALSTGLLAKSRGIEAGSAAATPGDCGSRCIFGEVGEVRRGLAKSVVVSGLSSIGVVGGVMGRGVNALGLVSEEAIA